MANYDTMQGLKPFEIPTKNISKRPVGCLSPSLVNTQ